MKKLSKHFLVISGLVGAWPSGLLADTFRKVERVGGQTYTIEYTMGENGALTATPTAILNNRGGWNMFTPGQAKIDPARITQKLITSVNGRLYSVRFSGSNSTLAAEPYAVDDSGVWRSLDVPSAKKDPEVMGGKTKAPKSSSVGEFRIYQSALEPFGSTFTETTKFREQGEQNDVYPNLTARATVVPLDSANTANFELRTTINGTAWTRGSDGRRRETSAEVTTTVNANFKRNVTATPTSVTGGPISGSVNMTPYIDPHSERILKRIAEGVAYRTALAEYRQKEPKKKAQMRQEVLAATDQALASTSKAMQNGIKELSGLGDVAKEIPLKSKLFSSASGPRGGSTGVGLELNDGAERSERPLVERPQQAVGSLFLHEDALNASIAPQLAGKRINIREAMKLICAHKLTKKLSFCNEEQKEKPLDAELLFDKDHPFKISFRDGQVKIELNAVHAVNFGGVEEGKQAKEDDLFKGNPYRIEVIYDIRPDRLVRKSVKLEERPQGFSNEDWKKAASNPSHAAGLLFGRAARYLASPKEKEELMKEYTKAFKEQAEFPIVSLPTSFHADNPKAGGKPRMVGAASYLPLETVSKDGWFGATLLMCTPGMEPLGVQFRVLTEQQKEKLYLSSVTKGSPADLAGLKPGDRITSYSVDGNEEKVAISKDQKVFQAAVAKSASEKEAGKRLMTFEGVNTEGVAFSVQVALCPKGLDHMKKATQTLESFSKL